MDSLQSALRDAVARTACTAIVLWPDGDIAASAFVHLLLSENRPRRVLLVRVRAEYVPHVRAALQAQATTVADGFQLVDLRFGFDDEPDIPLALSHIIDLEPASTRYYVIEDRSSAACVARLPRWRRLIFALLCAASVSATEYFHLPLDRTTEISIDRPTERARGARR